MNIKICGLTTKEDALHAVSLGVNAIGFIFYDKSPRGVTPEVVEEIVPFLPPFVQVVGVFVNEEKAVIDRLVDRCRLDIVQLHGEETPQFCLSMKRRVIKAIRVNSEDDIGLVSSYQGMVSAVLLDTKVEGVHGGTGKVFDWGLALKAKDCDIPLILSGGLNPGNIQRAIQTVNPYAVDISSGVESEPGKKDYQKMGQVVQIATSTI
jgi:phosphoribosylanthranilate isomerase